MSAVRSCVIQAIAECFGCDAAGVTDDTLAADVEGWDSLGHTMLMMRIELLLGLKIPEIVAANVENVGDLIAKLKRLRRQLHDEPHPPEADGSMLDYPVSALEGLVEKVAVGRDRLYLEKGAGFDAGAYYRQPYDDTAFFARHWDPALTRMALLCREIGARLIVVVAPDGCAVHPESLPDHLAYRAPSIGEAFAAHLRDDLGIEALYLRDLMKSACGGPVDIWRRNDSHWSAYGAYIGYRRIIERLRARWPADHGRPPECLGAEEVEYESRRMLGDLGWATEPPFVAEKLMPQIRAPRARNVSRRINELRQVISAFEIEEADLPRCVILRDSFATAMIPFLNESFGRIVYVGAGPHAFPELIRAERPDVVIIERGERSLTQGLTDWGFLGARELLPDIADPGAEALHNEARTMLVAGRRDDAENCARRAIEIDGGPDLKFTLARILIESKAHAEAEAALQAAIQDDRDRFSFHLFLGVAQLHQQKNAEAMATFQHATTLAPEHPLGFEHLGYAAILLARHAEAEAALARAAELWPERPAIHHWLSVACEHAGKLQQALTEAERAAELEPGHSIFAERAATLKKRVG